MRKNNLQYTILLLLLSSFLLLGACGKNKSSEVVTVGTSTAEYVTWNLIKDLAAEEDIELEVIKFDDYVQPNLALDSGEIDINAFQTVVYFDSFIEEHELDLSPIGTTSIWPMGIYSKEIDDLSELEDGAQVAIPNDPTNLGRALLLLEKAGLITVADDFDGSGGVENITENPHNLDIITVDSGQTARSLDDVALSLINSDKAIAADLNPTHDPVFREDAENKAYINIIASRTEDKDDETLNKIVDIFHRDEIAEFIEEEFAGAAVPIREPVSYIDDYEQN